MKREFLTPPELPEASECRTLIIPSSKEWLGIFNSALLDATYYYNFEQVNSTDLSPEETADICRQIFVNYLDSTCSSEPCEAPEMPEGGRIFRVGLAGRVEELQGGAWVEPEGDAELPPPDARTNPSEVDRLCLAAQNAAAVLAQLYEETLDEYQTNIDPVAGIVRYAGTAGTAVLLALGVVSYGLAFVAFGAFSVFYAVFEFLTEDMWNNDFTEKLVCILLDNASDAAGVVTFDYDGVMNDLANATDITSNFDELRLFGQIWYMMQFIGSQGLDLAGRTTSITSADCSECDDEWCATFDFKLSNGGWATEGGGTYVAGTGWRTTYFTGGGAGYRALPISVTLPSARTITYFLAEYEITWGGFAGSPADARNITMRLNQLSVPNDPVRQFFPNTSPTLKFTGSLAGVTKLLFLATTGYDSVPPLTDQGGQCTLKRVTVRGLGTNPFPTYACP